MTSERLSSLSSNEDEYIEASCEYQNVMKKSGFKGKLVYTPSNQRDRRQRNRKIIWYNPFLISRLKQTLAKHFYNH